MANFFTEKNIFEKLIGKCSVYPEELRAAGASYTAQEFNLLNDLKNLTINGEKLTAEQKKEIVEIVKSSNTVNMKKIVARVIGEEIESWSGARADKDEKEIKFETYKKMGKKLDTIGVDIHAFSREELDTIGHILTINTDKESILEAFAEEKNLSVSPEIAECLISLRKKNPQLFSKWHSFSLKLMRELIPAMYEEPKEQMTLLTEKNLLLHNKKDFSGRRYIPIEVASEELLNPVVRRSVRISFKIINALLKKYGHLDEIVIEMPRDKNEKEGQQKKNDAQKANEKEWDEVERVLGVDFDIKLKPEYFSAQEKLKLKLKLWHEQDGICLYSGKTIDPMDVIEHPSLFEIDHIIPRSISFDNSRNNKVLVYRIENQAKGNQTPYHYLTHTHNANWSFAHFKAKVTELSKKKNYGFFGKKVQNFLFDRDITKIDVLQGFINRNLNDTRYASRVVLNTLQSFFRAQDTDTKVKVIRGSFTRQMRVNMKLEKNREEDYSHHAVDAMLIAYSQMGYESYRKLQGTFIDFETGEILNAEKWQEGMTDKVYQEYLYGKKWTNIRQNILDAQKNIKYWHFVYRKCNRKLSDQTIRGTREYDNTIYKINKLDIRTDNGYKIFRKKALDEKKRETLLVYKNDRQTFDALVKIMEDYADAKNPFVQYEKETGDFVRKYAKNHNGPKIGKLKYTDGEVKTCIDISHKYGHEKDSRKVILENLVPYRMDVYYKADDGLYYFVGVKQSTVKCKGDKYFIDEDAYAKLLQDEKMISEGQTRADLPKLGYEFRLSFYKNDIIVYERNGEFFVECFLSRTMPTKRNYIETKPIDRKKFKLPGENKYKDRNFVGLPKTNCVYKYRMDILGNYYKCEREPFREFC